MKVGLIQFTSMKSPTSCAQEQQAIEHTVVVQQCGCLPCPAGVVPCGGENSLHCAGHRDHQGIW